MFDINQFAVGAPWRPGSRNEVAASYRAARTPAANAQAACGHAAAVHRTSELRNSGACAAPRPRGRPAPWCETSRRPPIPARPGADAAAKRSAPLCDTNGPDDVESRQSGTRRRSFPAAGFAVLYNHLGYRSIGAAQSAVNRHVERLRWGPGFTSVEAHKIAIESRTCAATSRFAGAFATGDDDTMITLNREMARNEAELAKLAGMYAPVQFHVNVAHIPDHRRRPRHVLTYAFRGRGSASSRFSRDEPTTMAPCSADLAGV